LVELQRSYNYFSAMPFVGSFTPKMFYYGFEVVVTD